MWLYTLYNKDCDKYWRDGENFDKEEFVEVAKCKGISEIQTCISKEETSSSETNEEEEEVFERRTKRKELCKKCFWFCVLLQILD